MKTQQKNMVVVPVALSPEWLKKKEKMFAELDKQVNANVIYGTGISLEELQLILERRCPEMVLEKWAKFYDNIFSIKPALSDIVIPPAQSGFGWTAICLQQIADNALWDAYKEQGIPRWSSRGDDFSAVIAHNDRGCRNGSYAILMRDRWEADEELKDLSADQLQEQSILCCTFSERLVIGLFQWWLTGGKNGGRHLDVKTVTLCSGSRYDVGHVPSVYCRDGEVRVSWFLPDGANDDLRARQVISCLKGRD